MIVTRLLIALSLGVASLAAQGALPAPNTLPAAATVKLTSNLAAAKAHAKHVWRDTPPINDDGTINGYIEIAEGDRQKWELNMAKNARAIDRIIPETLGGYPINYGFVPQTVSYDGDPFDVLVLGPPIDGGRTVRGKPVGVMFMQDDGVIDSKVVITPLDSRGRPMFQITDEIRRKVGNFFGRYKQHIPGASTSVPGWGTPEQGMELVRITHAFFKDCRQHAGAQASDCVVARPK